MQNIIIHYSEIALKGKNRAYFENKLIQNIKKALNAQKTYKRYGKIICETKNTEKAEEILKKIPGIALFSFAEQTELNINKIKKTAEKLIKKEKTKTFTIKTKRSNKQFPLTSPQINKQIAQHIEKTTGKTGQLKKAQTTLYIEIGEKNAYLYTQKHKGTGGLPTGTSGKIISMLSGGIDSPTASYMLMKRGAKIIFAHFYNEKIQKNRKKIEELTKQLTKYQLQSKLYLIKFGELQQELIKKIPSKLRMIVYRRYMIKIANKIAQKEKAKAITTGDNLGQVASQTLQNLKCAYDATKIPILTPLIGMNKEEIMQTAKKIGTYETSIKKYKDCCSYLIAQHPETNANLQQIKELEKQIDNKIIEKALEKTEIKKYEI